MARAKSRMRLFNPRKLARYETLNYVYYYERRWLDLLRVSIRFVQESAGLNYVQAMYGAFLLARAEFAWAPQDHDLRVVEKNIRALYRFIRRINRETFDLDRVTQAELAWWIAHREHFGDPNNEAVIQAFTNLNAELFQRPHDEVYEAAYWRAAAVSFSDWWVEEKLDPYSPRLKQEEQAFVIAYTHLRAVVARA